MITNNGKLFFKNYLANQSAQIIGAASFGIGDASATAADRRLQFEFARTPLTVVTFDPVANSLVFKGTLPQEASGLIYEVGLWTAENSVISSGKQGRLITTFDSDTEEWVNETFSGDARIGVDSLRHAPLAGQTVSSRLGNLSLDFYDNLASESFILAYKVGNGNVDSITMSFNTDESNYFQMNIINPSTGYHFANITKGSLLVTGSPDWADITSIDINTTAKPSGTAVVNFDGLRIEDNDFTSLDYGMVARYIPTTPLFKPQGQILDFEYSVAVNI